jgi:hypothetical protein
LNTERNWWVNFWGFPNNPFRNSENFGFSKAVPMRLFVPKPTREESAFPLSTLLAFFTARFAGHNVSGSTATGWKSCRCAVPSLGLRATGLEAAPFSKISEPPARSQIQSRIVFHLLEKCIGVIKNGTE